MALWDGVPVAFCGVINQYGQKNRRRITRVVTLPDYQGVGIGARMLETVCSHERRTGVRIGITSSHPAIIGYCKRSPMWVSRAVSRVGSRRNYKVNNKTMKTSQGRSVVSFEFVGSAAG